MLTARAHVHETLGAHSACACARVCVRRYMDAYHSLARAISLLGDAESAVSILQLATKMEPYDGSMCATQPFTAF